jgi:hypothetical protein
MKHFVNGKIKDREDEKENVSDYCMALRKPEDTGN